MGITILSNVFFPGNSIINAALIAGQREFEEKQMSFDTMQGELMESKTMDEFINKYNKLFEGEIAIRIKNENI